MDMTMPLGRRSVLLAGAAALAPLGGVAHAQTKERVLRITESTLGEADPHKPVDYPGSILMLNVYDFLLRAKAGGGLEPGLAASWEVAPDGLGYTFHLRDGVKFHDGSMLTAKDVVFSANRMLTLKRGFAYLFSKVKSIDALDPATVRISVSEPFAPFLASLTRLAVVSEAIVTANRKPGTFGDLGDYGQAYLSTADAGSGAYTIARHDAQQESQLRKFAGYWGETKPKAPDLVRLRYGVEPTTVRALMGRHELDLTRPPLPAEIVTGLAKMPGISLVQDRQAQQFQFKLNTQKAPTDDVNVRKAMALAFDYDSLYSLLDVAGLTAGTPARGPIPQGVLGYDASSPIPKRDVAAAKAALAASKHPTGAKVDLLWMQQAPQEEKFALLFQESMSEIGIEVNIIAAPWPQIQQLATSAAATPHVSCIFVGITTPDIDSLFWPEYHSSSAGTYNSMQWLQLPEIDKALEQGRALLQDDARAAHYRALSEKIAALYPALFVYDNANIVVRQTYVKAPALEGAKDAVAITAGNYQFRLMEIDT